MLDINKIIKKYLFTKTILASIIIIIFGYVFEKLIFTQVYSKIITNISSGTEITIKLITLLIGIHILGQLCFYTVNIIDAYYIPKIELDIMRDIIDIIIRNPEVMKINKNEILVNLKKINDIKYTMSLFNYSFAPTFVLSIAICIYFFYHNKLFGITTFVMLVIMGCLLYAITINYLEKSQKVDKEMNILYDDVYDILTNADSVHISNTFDSELKRIDKNKDAVYTTFRDTELSNSNLVLFLTTLYFIVLLLINLFTYKLYTNGLVETTDIVSIFYISSMLIQWYYSLIYRLRNFIVQMGKYNEASDFFNSFNVAEENKKSNKTVKITTGNIEFKNINLKYNNKIILTNFNQTVKGGSHVGIKGDIGSGKTSLLKMLMGLINYDGDILIDGQSVKNINTSDIIGFVPQNPNLFNRSIYENIAYGTNYSIDYVQNWLNELKLGDFISKFKDGLRTNVGRNGNLLSGGQRQIVYILRILLQNKKIILMDEPTSSIDNYSREQLIRLIKDIKKTVIIVTHDDKINTVFDKIVLIK